MLGIGKILGLAFKPFMAVSEIATSQDILSTMKQMMSTAWRSLAMGPGGEGAVDSARSDNKAKSYIDSNGRFVG